MEMTIFVQTEISDKIKYTYLPGIWLFFHLVSQYRGRQDCVAIRYGMDGPGIESRCGRNFPHHFRPALGPTQPAVQWIRGLFADDEEGSHD
jgi:hypothetical protein